MHADREVPAEIPSREELIRRLQEADGATLLMSLICLTGDSAFLDDTFRPGPLAIGQWYQERLAADGKAAVCAQLADALLRFWSGNFPPVPAPDNETLMRLTQFYTGTDISDAYAGMFSEELALDGADKRRFSWTTNPPPEERAKFHVLVIGAGMSGLLAAKRLREAGIPFTVIEKNGKPGGTWHENRYPGCRVDVGNHFYSYSFSPGHQWNSYFSQRDELAAFFEEFVGEEGLLDSIQFSTEALAAEFHRDRWTVEVRRPDGSSEHIEANVVISAVGQLNRPKYPDIPGRESFAGVSMHTARWDDSVDLAGKRIAVVGTGASAFQVVPELAKMATSLTVFQRQPPWMKYNPRYHDEVSPEVQWVMAHVPTYSRWFRFLMLWHLGDATLPGLIADPEWAGAPRSLSASNEALRELLTAHITAQVGDDPELLRKVLPSYPPGGKRMLQDNGLWLQTLRQAHVDLVDTPISRIEGDAIIDAEGRAHEVDIIVYATGFDSIKMLAPMEVSGRDGQKIHASWAEGPSAYLTVTSPGFPNFFFLYGPGANLSHGGSIIFVSECQVRYILDAVRLMIEKGIASMEVTEEACSTYLERFDEAASRLVMAHPSVNNWYKTTSGRMVTNWPWRLLDMWQMMHHVDLDDYLLERTSVPEVAA
ncbi:NAD(P)/FAD-dependent oxidoreductase [Sphingobium sp. V4]|uniref:flavin-containing monooxygenase n=1 Tax=Sphingobium sp. V4 TaxID=3038927 RepID=UPI00255834B9|nr:NAD(P)/FAD-dependent oxidoreductase [Sphingobium sp. V4]WIW89420.1 NAD(P)/FAD-dependent oxidoreductase [Sphingobium sp. V4]